MYYQKSHIAYCSNVHPGQSLSKVTENISSHFEPVKQKRHLSEMASGLWLSADAAKLLSSSPEELSAFKETLDKSGMLLTSLNGFPYGNFHQGVVKQDVYLPTWAQTERLEYSITLAKILSSCLPEAINFGAISTLPLGYAKNWDNNQHQLALSNIVTLANALQAIEKDSGKRITVCIEMEPDCVLQSTHEFIHFFTKDLIPFAQQQGTSKADILRYIGCCFDTCHQGVMNENIQKVLTEITQAGITIGKIQISNAVQAILTSENDIEQLTTLFKDEKFLHQTKIFDNNTLVAELDDLSEQEMLSIFRQHNNEESVSQIKCEQLVANVHYHIPINQTQMSHNFMSSTQPAIEATLDFLHEYLMKSDAQIPYLEIETYTWLNFLTDKSATNNVNTLHQGLFEEFVWLEQALTNRNMLSNSASRL
jgi:hypothetical protein